MATTLNWSLLSDDEKSTMSITLQMETIRKRQIDHRRQQAEIKRVGRRQVRHADKEDAVSEMLGNLNNSDMAGTVFINRSDVNYIPKGFEKEDVVAYINVSAVDKPVRVFLYSANSTIRVNEVAEALHMFYTGMDNSKCHAQQAVMTGVDFAMVPRLLGELEKLI